MLGFQGCGDGARVHYVGVGGGEEDGGDCVGGVVGVGVGGEAIGGGALVGVWREGKGEAYCGLRRGSMSGYSSWGVVRLDVDWGVLVLAHSVR